MLLGETAPSDPLAPLARESALLLAVSGGPDSVALMLLAARWPRRAAGVKITVATVDHGLRENSREEALQVGRWAGALGFDHRLLSWEGPKPTSRVQESARAARYALLCACAREIARECALVTAHHADDQAETILFRLTRGSGVAGLSGMASVSTRDGVRLLRPLLDVPKAALEAICDEAGHPFFRDPANENTRFARARLRALSATLSAQGLDRGALLRLGGRAARAEFGAEMVRFQREKDGGSRLRRRGDAARRSGAARLAARDFAAVAGRRDTASRRPGAAIGSARTRGRSRRPSSRRGRAEADHAGRPLHSRQRSRSDVNIGPAAFARPRQTRGRAAGQRGRRVNSSVSDTLKPSGLLCVSIWSAHLASDPRAPKLRQTNVPGDGPASEYQITGAI